MKIIIKRYYGALTSKNLKYTLNGRKWELDILRTTLIQEPFFPYIHLERRGQQLLRILPVVGSQEWLDNRIRFFGSQRKYSFNFSENNGNNKFFNSITKKCEENLLFSSHFALPQQGTKEIFFSAIYIDLINSTNVKKLQNIIFYNMAMFLFILKLKEKYDLVNNKVYKNILNLKTFKMFFKFKTYQFSNLVEKIYVATLHSYLIMYRGYKFSNKFDTTITNTRVTSTSLGYFYALNFAIDYYEKLRLFGTAIIAKNLLNKNHYNTDLINFLPKATTFATKVTDIFRENHIFPRPTRKNPNGFLMCAETIEEIDFLLRFKVCCKNLFLLGYTNNEIKERLLEEYVFLKDIKATRSLARHFSSINYYGLLRLLLSITEENEIIAFLEDLIDKSITQLDMINDKDMKDIRRKNLLPYPKSPKDVMLDFDDDGNILIIAFIPNPFKYPEYYGAGHIPYAISYDASTEYYGAGHIPYAISYDASEEEEFSDSEEAYDASEEEEFSDSEEAYDASEEEEFSDSEEAYDASEEEEFSDSEEAYDASEEEEFSDSEEAYNTSEKYLTEAEFLQVTLKGNFLWHYGAQKISDEPDYVEVIFDETFFIEIIEIY